MARIHPIASDAGTIAHHLGTNRLYRLATDDEKITPIFKANALWLAAGAAKRALTLPNR